MLCLIATSRAHAMFKVQWLKWWISSSTTSLFMVFNVTYIIYEGPKLDASRFQSVTYANC